MYIRSLVSALVVCVLAPVAAFAQGTWNVALTPTMNPLPVGFCAAIHLTIFDASGQVPRHRTGYRVTISDFDIAVTGASVIAHQIDASHWESCACQGGAPGTVATVTATYRAQPVAGPVQVPSFTKMATFVTAAPKGTINPPPCLTAGGAPASQPPPAVVTSPPAAPPAAPPVTVAPPAAPPVTVTPPVAPPVIGAPLGAPPIARGPTVRINQLPLYYQPDPTNVAVIRFEVVFSEPITGFDATDVSLAGSTVGGTLMTTLTSPYNGPHSYMVQVTGLIGPGVVVASIPANAVANTGGQRNSASTSSDHTVTFNRALLTVRMNQESSQLDPTSASPIVFEVVFSDLISGFDAADVSFAGSTVGGTLVASIKPGGTIYSYLVEVTGMVGPGVVAASIRAGAATDGGGGGNSASTSSDPTVTFQ